MTNALSKILCAGAVGVLISCSAVAQEKSPTAVQTAAQTPPTVRGYLASTAVPSSVAVVPTPPAAGSSAMARDEEINRSALAMRGTPRWNLATQDAVLTFPALAKTFSCALSLPVREEQTPKLIALLRRTAVDAGRATREAKQLYKRTRPFAVNGNPICTPDREDGLRRDGSYPSGHSSIGWSLGLVLAEVSPDQANALIARGRAFGQSRLVCNVHWQSDVQEGQMVGSAVVARLNADPAFRRDVAAARAEVEALRSKLKSQAPEGNCDAEATVIKSWN